MFHFDLLSTASNPTPLRHQPAEIRSDHNEYAINYILDVKIGSWLDRRGRYIQFLKPFVGYDVPEWMLHEQMDECKLIFKFLS